MFLRLSIDGYLPSQPAIVSAVPPAA
jgi:hypothetical protein